MNWNWLAGFFDADGSLFTLSTGAIQISFGNRDKACIEAVKDIIGENVNIITAKVEGCLHYYIHYCDMRIVKNILTNLAKGHTMKLKEIENGLRYLELFDSKLTTNRKQIWSITDVDFLKKNRDRDIFELVHILKRSPQGIKYKLKNI